MQNTIKKDDILFDVYGRRFGYRMFDANYLTEDIYSFLAAEKDAFSNFLDLDKFDTVIEVGCGYGRYTKTVIEQEKQYVGIDLISWLIEFGDWYSSVSNSMVGSESITLKTLSIVNIESLILNANFKKPVVFLPFNCLGNLSYFETVVQTLSKLGITIACSLFNDHKTTTKSRLEYYDKCGLTGLHNQNFDTGAVITSTEGFDSVGYNLVYFENFMKKYGYLKKDSFDLNGFGGLFLFEQKQVSLVQTVKPKQPISLDTYEDRLARTSLDEIKNLPKRFSVKKIYYVDWVRAQKNSVYQATGLLPFDFKTVKSFEEILVDEDYKKPHTSPMGVVELFDHEMQDCLFYPIKL